MPMQSKRSARNELSEDQSSASLDGKLGIRLGELIEKQVHGLPGHFRQPIQVLLQSIDVLYALRRYDTELRHVGSDGVADLRALANQKVSRAVKNQNR